MNSDYNEIIQYDEWLSSKLGYNAYHLSESFSKIDFSKISGQNYFIDAKIDVASTEKIPFLCSSNFNLVDTNIQLKKETFDLDVKDSSCGFADVDDKEVIAKIAQSCFTKTRFHLDPFIPKETANIIKADWTRSFFEGKRGNWMIVAKENNTVYGFLQVISNPSIGLIIDLIGVDRPHQGKSYGTKMIAFALKNCPTEKKSVIVGTQLCNTDSLNFYQKLGFSINSAKYVFHLHNKNHEN